MLRRFQSRIVFVGASTLFAVALVVAAQLPGSIFTTLNDGATVNGNIYPSKSAVYLNGGPQNENGSLLNDGLYYFQVTDPSGGTLLSTDDITCRQVVVANGRIAGVPIVAPPATCTTGFHLNGLLNGNNGGSIPVQLLPFNDTPNNGGEYKVWITPVLKYDAVNCSTGGHGGKDGFGFCESDSKTDNFKIKSPSTTVKVCKFDDLNDDGDQDTDEPLIKHWPISATGVATGTGNAQTDDNGCVTFTVTSFGPSDTATVTLTEGTRTNWHQTAPPADADNTDGITVTGGVITLIVRPGDNVTAPYFGNHLDDCGANCNLNELVVTKTAIPTFNRLFEWDISKDVDETTIETSAGATATFNYTVGVTHDGGTDSGWKITGVIRVSNPGGGAISGISLSDATDNLGTCTISDPPGVNQASFSLAGGAHQDFNYECTYGSLPGDGTNTATATATTPAVGPFTGTAEIDFDEATPVVTDNCVTVTDTIAGNLGQVCSTDPSPKDLTYSNEVTAPSGTCDTIDNTATLTTSDTQATASAGKSVTVCGGADLTVTKTATPAKESDIAKAVNKTLVEQAGGSYTFNYTVTVTQSGWTVTGKITVTNPNDWEDITADVTDSVGGNGGVCTVTGGTAVVVAAESSVDLDYSCTYASAPAAASGINTGTATWDEDAFHTPSGTASGTANFTFVTLTVKDTFDGTEVTLGTVAGNVASKEFKYDHTVPAPTGGTCRTYNNTATIPGDSASQSVTICNTATGALTIGFWQNKNGQEIIGSYSGTNCQALRTWLNGFAPFADLTATTCANVKTYVTNIIKSANASGASMNAMLKAQMLATALDVYFSSPALGGNRIGVPAALALLGGIGSVEIDLTHVNKPINSANYEDASSSFGGATSLTVLEMLNYAASRSNSGGTIWYNQKKSGTDSQELAKDAFDAINNAVAWIAP